MVLKSIIFLAKSFFTIFSGHTAHTYSPLYTKSHFTFKFMQQIVWRKLEKTLSSLLSAFVTTLG